MHIRPASSGAEGNSFSIASDRNIRQGRKVDGYTAVDIGGSCVGRMAARDHCEAGIALD